MIDASNFDASWASGPTIWRKAAGLAAAFGVELGHHAKPQIASYLLASVPHHTFVECFDEEKQLTARAQDRSPTPARLESRRLRRNVAYAAGPPPAG